MKRKATGLAMIFVSGILAYLILAIGIWQAAWSAPLAADEDRSFDSIGIIYDMYTSGKDDDFLPAFSYVHGAVFGSLHTRAMIECTVDGDADFACYEHRYKTLLGYLIATVETAVGTTTNNDVVRVFFNWAVNNKLDENVTVSFASSVFIGAVVNTHEQSQ